MMPRDGDKVGVCPECGGNLIFEMSFEDRFSPVSGHYTVDRPIMACLQCDFCDDFVDEEEVEETEWMDVHEEQGE